jgi:P27 family predicted phage terminase small subunit
MARERISLEEHELRSTRPQYVLADSDVPAGRPKYPKNISPEAKSAFKRLVKMLEARRTVTSGDSEVLHIYAVLFDRPEKALEHLRTEGEIVECEAVTKNGELYTISKPNLWLKIAQDSEARMFACLQQLGLTPRTRTQVKKTEEPKKPQTQFPSREEATSAPASDADLLNSIDESKVN